MYYITMFNSIYISNAKCLFSTQSKLHGIFVPR